jgi:hypothetical protein
MNNIITTQGAGPNQYDKITYEDLKQIASFFDDNRRVKMFEGKIYVDGKPIFLVEVMHLPEDRAVVDKGERVLYTKNPYKIIWDISRTLDEYIEQSRIYAMEKIMTGINTTIQSKNFISNFSNYGFVMPRQIK